MKSPIHLPHKPNAAAAEVEAAARTLRAGGLVAFPTETVYGLGADASNPDAVRRIFEAKGRPADHPLIVHIPGAGVLGDWATEIPAVAWSLAEAFWPGPLTLILRRSAQVPDEVTGGLETVGLRVPAHPVALQLLHAFGGGVAAPSANRFGAVSPTTAAHVREELGEHVDHLLDGGACQVGVESTIVDVTRGDPVVLRPGGISAEALQQVMGHAVPWERHTSEQPRAVRAPGQHASHYAPRARLIVVEPRALAAELQALAATFTRVAVLSPTPPPASPYGHWMRLPQHPDDLARDLYALLREVDRQAFPVAIITAPSDAGLGQAIRDRLQRAATPR